MAPTPNWTTEKYTCTLPRYPEEDAEIFLVKDVWVGVRVLTLAPHLTSLTIPGSTPAILDWYAWQLFYSLLYVNASGSIDVSVRDYRCLGYALQAQGDAMLTNSTSDLDEASVSQLLRQWLPEGGLDRSINFPMTYRGNNAEVGDVGRWIVPEDRYPTLVRFCNVRDSNFGGYSVRLKDNPHNFEIIQSNLSHYILRSVVSRYWHR